MQKARKILFVIIYLYMLIEHARLAASESISSQKQMKRYNAQGLDGRLDPRRKLRHPSQVPEGIDGSETLTASSVGLTIVFVSDALRAISEKQQQNVHP